jgi:hypothetical protein
MVLAQTIYSWVDKDGEEHFTDDPATIPAKARRRTTAGEPISTVGKEGRDGGADEVPAARSSSAAEPDAPTVSELRWRGLFRAAYEKIADLEQAVESDRHLVEDNVLPLQLVCRGPAGTACLYLPSSELEEAKRRSVADRAALARARSALEDLDRRASNAGVPREWRR